MPRSITPSAQKSSDPTTLVPFSILRTETVLSRFPIHTLSKRGRVTIDIQQKNTHGDLTVRWEVSYNERYGPARQLAYKLDTIVINQRLDTLPRPLPRLIKVGSLRHVCTLLDLDVSGRQQAELKKAFHQNASAYVVAYLRYRGRDGVERTLNAGFTRYSVIFTGERLPNGTMADAVYLLLSEPYLEVLNHAPVRPLDYTYLKTLTPMAQRFYEILSYKMFAALRHRHAYATLRYTDYCLLSTQQRYTDGTQVNKQMYKVHRPHLASGYLAKVRYEATTDEEGQPDWVLYYTPGPKAHAEYATYMRQPETESPARPLAHAAAHDAINPPVTPAETVDPVGPVSETSDPLDQQAEDLIRQFYTRFHGCMPEPPSAKERDQARHLLGTYGRERSVFLLEYSARVAPETQYKPQTFGGILHYLPRALAAYAAPATPTVPQAISLAHWRERYAVWRRETLLQHYQALAPEDIARMEAVVRPRVLAEGTKEFALGLATRMAIDALLEEQARLPTFEEWYQQQGSCPSSV